MSPLFRDEALRHHFGSQKGESELRLAPRWVGWLFWLLVLAFVGAALALRFGTVEETASASTILQKQAGSSSVQVDFAPELAPWVVPGAKVRLETRGPTWQGTATVRTVDPLAGEGVRARLDLVPGSELRIALMTLPGRGTVDIGTESLLAATLPSLVKGSGAR